MADELDQNDGLDITDSDAEKLLDDDPASQPEPDRGDTGLADEVTKWKRLSRKNEDEKKVLATRLREYEDANKSESQRLQEERDSHKTRAEKAEAALRRREIAEESAPDHATLVQIKGVAKRLSGDSDEALAEDARELFGLLAPEPAKPKTTSRPKERLRGGGDPEGDDPDDTDDPRKLADLIRGVRRT